MLLAIVFIIIIVLGYKIYNRNNSIKNDEFVYVDKSEVFHIDKECGNIDGGVIWVRKDEIKYLGFVCTECVNKNEYKELEEIADRNK